MALIRSFGSHPTGADKERMKQSPNYKSGGFANLSPTEIMASREPLFKSAFKFLNKPRNTTPARALPSIKTDLRHLHSDQPVIVWFGHSSYFMKVGGKNILVDPVFSGHASPFRFGVASFPGTDIYAPIDFPDIDLLIITHDHYDHLDYSTLKLLKPKIRAVATSLGVGSHLRYWGFDKKIITEFDWWRSAQLLDDITLTATPARHFSGRTLNRNQSLWSSFVLEFLNLKMYIGADSGYDVHFKTIGDKFKWFDIAMLETGQYNSLWPQIHMTPEEAVQAALDLNARVLMPVHWGKFALAFHPWEEPVERASVKAKEVGLMMTTPRIGEPVFFGQPFPTERWWVPYV